VKCNFFRVHCLWISLNGKINAWTFFQIDFKAGLPEWRFSKKTKQCHDQIFTKTSKKRKYFSYLFRRIKIITSVPGSLKCTNDHLTEFLGSYRLQSRVAWWCVFKPKIPLWRVLHWEMLVYFMTIWYIWWPLGILYGYMVYFPPFRYVVLRKKSGNPALKWCQHSAVVSVQKTCTKCTNNADMFKLERRKNTRSKPLIKTA
jgi:hypothetical protein